MSSSPIESVESVAERRGASVLFETLIGVGCEYVFGNPGTTELPLIDALLDTPRIKYVWSLQEASAVAMADVYAQAAGRPGFINLHTAGGLGHGMGNLLNASVSCTPLVVTARSRPEELNEAGISLRRSKPQSHRESLTLLKW